ncbi:MAG: glycoside hydrolase family 130 protein [Opitutaceae bacterium]
MNTSTYRDATTILKRHPQNPLIRLEDHPGTAQIYNPSPVQFGDETLMLVSVVDHAATRGYGRDVGQTRIARSSDGVNFTLGRENFIDVQSDEMPWSLYHHYIDNRVTKIDDTYYIITPVMVKGFDGPVGMLGRTTDFKRYERMAIITAPKNRGASLFPAKIGGRYWKLDRPGGGDGGNGDIWISSSPDLIHWGHFQPLLAAGYRYWNSQKIGPTPPVWTPEGWLDIMHGVFTPAGGTYYYVGAILLDLEQPWKIIGKTNSWILAPREPYERNGNCDNTVFPCGALGDWDKDELRLYYGATDDKICLATGSMRELVEACKLGL